MLTLLSPMQCNTAAGNSEETEDDTHKVPLYQRIKAQRKTLSKIVVDLNNNCQQLFELDFEVKIAFIIARKEIM